MSKAKKYRILGEKVHLFTRPGSPYWQCSIYLDGKERRINTKKKELTEAKQFAEDWYFDLLGKKIAVR